MSRRKVNTVHPNDPVIVSADSDPPGHVILRIGQQEPGQTRYAVCTRTQALRIAFNLMLAVEETRDDP